MGVGGRGDQGRGVVENPEQVVVVGDAEQGVDPGDQGEAPDDPQVALTQGMLEGDQGDYGGDLRADQEHGPQDRARRERAPVYPQTVDAHQDADGRIAVGVAGDGGDQPQGGGRDDEGGDHEAALAEVTAERGDQGDRRGGDQEVGQGEGLVAQGGDGRIEQGQDRAQLLEKQAVDRRRTQDAGEVPGQQALVVDIAAVDHRLDAEREEHGRQRPDHAPVAE